MNKIIGVTAGGIALVAIIAIWASAGATGGKKEFAVVFDNAKGLVPGQQLKIAGAAVGRIEEVSVAPGPRARVLMTVEPQFMPLPADTRCTIRPEGIISENFVECDLGESNSSLVGEGDDVPTVPVGQTTQPLTLQDVLNVFSLPTSERIRVLISELGLGTAGRGDDINAILRRANPALQDARRAIRVANTQKAAITAAVEQTDLVLSSLKTRERDIRSFVDDAASVTELAATKQASLEQTVAKLPALLDATGPALRSVDAAIADGTPVLRDLRAAGKPLDRTLTSLRGFMSASRSPIEKLGDSAQNIAPQVEDALPLVKQLNAAVPSLTRFGGLSNTFFASLRDTGGLEGTLRFIYSAATTMAGYDGTSHSVGLFIRPFGQCLFKSNAPGCSSRYGAPGNGQIPPDDPTCGARSGVTWAPITDCRSALGVLPIGDLGSKKEQTRKSEKEPAKEPQPASSEPQRTDPQPSSKEPAPVLPKALTDAVQGLLGPLTSAPQDGRAPSAGKTLDDVGKTLEGLLGK